MPTISKTLCIVALVFARTLVARRFRRLLSLSEASSIFNDEIHKSQITNSYRNDEPTINRTTESDQSPLEKLVVSSRPTVAAYLCLQLDIDFSYLLPGLWVNIGVLGGIRIDPNTGCWSTNFEVSIGFEWGLKALGYYIGMGFMGIGAVELTEVPVAKTNAGPDVERLFRQLYLPDGADPNRCHTGNPFTLIQTYVEHQYWRIFQSSEAKLSTRDIAQIRQKEVELTNTYNKFLNSTFEEREVTHDIYRLIRNDPVEDWVLDVEKGGGEPPLAPKASYLAVSAPALLSPAVAMFAMARYFVGTLPAYATQVIERLVDNSQTLFGPDNERKNSNNDKRVRKSNGRLLARWPDEGLLDSLEVVDISGVSKRGEGADQRVINFAKVARLSENNRDPLFWKEFAMSAGNLLVRTLSDVHTLFSAYFANDPKWDGSCESLVSSFPISEASLEDKKFKKVFEAYPWASRSTKEKKRAAFSDIEEVIESRGADVVKGLPGISTTKDMKVYPHLWCVLGEDAPSPVEENTELLEFRRATQPFELSLVQTCQSVVHETRELLPDDRIVWNEIVGRYDVTKKNTNIFAGFLYSKGGEFYGTVCRSCISEDDPHREALQKGFVVANRKMEARLECEKARLSVAFVRIFPRFAYISKQFLLRMETVLLGINVCLDQVHNREFLTDSFHQLKDYNGIKRYCNVDTPTEDKLEYISALGKHAISLVRMLLVRLGAHTNSETRPDDRIPLSPEEKSLALRGDKFFAPTAHYLASDFFEAFGLGPEVQAGPPSLFMQSHAKKLFIDVGKINETDMSVYRYVLQGNLWPHFSKAITRLFSAIDPTHRVRNGFESRLRPPLEFTQSLTFSAQLARTEFCTEGGMPNAGLFIFRATRKVTRRTWSQTEISPQTCLSVRIRPGDFYVQVQQCYGSVIGSDGIKKGFSDWSVKVASFALKFFSSPGSFGGVLGNILSSGTGPLQSSVLSAAQLGGDALSLVMAKKIGPYVRDSKILKGLLTMGILSSPLLSVLGVTGTVTSEAGFLNIVGRFLEHLSHHGEAIALAPGTVLPPFYAFDSGVSSILTLITENGHKQWDDGSYEKRDSFHVESWNRVVFGGLALPSAARVQVYGRLDIDWDLSSWLRQNAPPIQNTSVEAHG